MAYLFEEEEEEGVEAGSDADMQDEDGGGEDAADSDDSDTMQSEGAGRAGRTGPREGGKLAEKAAFYSDM